MTYNALGRLRALLEVAPCPPRKRFTGKWHPLARSVRVLNQPRATNWPHG